MTPTRDPSTFHARLDECGPASDRVWVAALAIGLGFTLVAAYLFPFSTNGKFWAYAGLFIRASLYLWSGDALRDRGGAVLSRLFQVGIVAGVFELLVDWALIHWVPNGRLVYLTDNDVVLLGSPVWMPLAWACVIVELGYPSLRLYGILRHRLGTRAATVLSWLSCGIGAGVTVGFYEYFAYRAQWWRYEPAHVMIGKFCPVYIPLGEAFMFFALLGIAKDAIGRDRSEGVAASVVGGVRFFHAIAAGYVLAYLLLEAGRAP